MSEKTLSRIAWEKHRTFIEPDLPESFLDSEWESMHPKYKTAWDAVVMSILDLQPCVHPWAYIHFDYQMKPKCTKCGKEP